MEDAICPVGRPLDHLDVFLIAGSLVLIQGAAEDVERVSEVIAEDASELPQLVNEKSESIDQYSLSRERRF